MPLAIILLLIIILVIIVANIKIVPQAHSYIIERLGGYYAHGVSDFILKCRL